jgi:lipopolysaccharide transport system ATP-binding protein
MSAITVSHLGKAYKQYSNRWTRLLEWLRPSKQYHRLKWVMQDVSFTVNPGESLGIIGINGAGKSTLLKMITGTTAPTTGSIHLSGRVAALLELGMGFHPEFTGRQNIYISGQLLGMTHHEITRCIPDIVAFAEIGDYLDQPVRVYSSGMQMRLAFSVATAVRPDILIIDEALSVGDAYFQHKSFDRIREFKQQGTTLLIVSHDKQAIQSICDRALLINAGRVELEGKPEEVMDYYNALLANHQTQSIRQEKIAGDWVQTISGTGEAVVEDIYLLNSANERIEHIDVGQRVTLCVKVRANQDIPRLVLGYGIKDRLGQVIFGSNTDLINQAVENIVSGQEILYHVTFNANLGPGSYSVQTALVSTDTHIENNYEWRDLAMMFNVINMNKPHFAGSTWLESDVRMVM